MVTFIKYTTTSSTTKKKKPTEITSSNTNKSNTNINSIKDSAFTVKNGLGEVKGSPISANKINNTKIYSIPTGQIIETPDGKRYEMTFEEANEFAKAQAGQAGGFISKKQEPIIESMKKAQEKLAQEKLDQQTVFDYQQSQRKAEIEKQLQTEQAASKREELKTELATLGNFQNDNLKPTNYAPGDIKEAATAAGISLAAGAAGGAAMGAGIGSIVPGAGTVIGGALGGVIGGIGGLITGTYSSFSSAKKQDVRESAAAFTSAKNSINRIITATNRGEISPQQAIELYNGALRDIKQAQVDLKQLTQDDVLAFVADGGDEYIKVQEWLDNEDMYRQQLLNAILTPNPNAIPTYELGE